MESDELVCDSARWLEARIIEAMQHYGGGTWEALLNIQWRLSLGWYPATPENVRELVSARLHDTIEALKGRTNRQQALSGVLVDQAVMRVLHGRC